METSHSFLLKHVDTNTSFVIPIKSVITIDTTKVLLSIKVNDESIIRKIMNMFLKTDVMFNFDQANKMFLLDATKFIVTVIESYESTYCYIKGL